MTRLSDRLPVGAVRLEVPAERASDVLAVLAELLGGQEDSVREAVLDDLVAREQISSTGVGGGVAFPHARADFLPGIRVAVVRTSSPVPFGAMDGKDVDLFFAIAGPSPNRRDYLAVLSQLAYMFRSPTVREEFRAARSPENVVELVKRHAPESAERS